MSFDKLRTNDNWLIPFVVSPFDTLRGALSSHQLADCHSALIWKGKCKTLILPSTLFRNPVFAGR
jgi:hypothetical protein